MARRGAAAFRFVGIGWYIGICILGGTLGGRWIGQQIDGGGVEVILTIVGLMLGLIVAFYGTYRMLKEITSEN
jgi:hypothetical protein